MTEIFILLLSSGMFIVDAWYLGYLFLAYHPQTDGQTEKQNRTIEYIIHCMVQKGSSNWLHAILMMELVINGIIQDNIGLSPEQYTGL